MPETSPYFLGGGGGLDFGPPSGLAALFADRSKHLQEDADSIGSFAGMIGGGIVGGVQGAAAPEAFGAGTSSAKGAGLGFMQNVNSVANGGNNFKQLQALGKSADAFRDAMKSAIPKMDGQDEQPVLGMTDDEWKTKGSLERFNAVGSAVKAQAQQEVIAKLQDYAAMAQQRQAQGKFGTMVSDWSGANPDKTLDGPTLLKFAAQAGMKGPDALAYIKGVQEVSGQDPNRFEFDPNKDVAEIPNLPGRYFVKTSKGGGQVMESPEAMAGDIMATKPTAEDVPEGYMSLRVGKGWKVMPDETQFVTTRDPFSGEITRRFVGRGKGGAVAPDSRGPKAGDVVKGYKFLGGDPADPKNWEKQ